MWFCCNDRLERSGGGARSGKANVCFRKPALSASLAMILAVLLLGVLTEASSAWLRLVLQVICGAIVYILYCFLFHRDRIRVLYDFVRPVHH